MKSRLTRQTRREFFHSAGAVVAAPYVISSAARGAAGGVPPSQRVTTALIGSGGRGQQIMAGGDRVVAVCDVDAKHRETARATVEKVSGIRGCAAYGDFRDVLAREDIDAVVIATPDHWHVPITAAAVKAGKAVYVEKPLSLSIREGRILADLVRRYGAIVQVGSQQRTEERFIRACELVRNSRLGRVQTVKVEIETRPGPPGKAGKIWSPQPVPKELDYEMWLGPAPWAPYHKDRCHYNFRFVSDYSGGDVTNWGAHHLDIAQWALAADGAGPLDVEGRGKRLATGLHNTFYDIDVEFTYPDGVKVQLRSGGADVGTGNVRFEGTQGWILVSRERLDANPKSLLTSQIGPDEIHLAPPGGASTHMGIWLDCVRSRNPKGLNAPVEVGHRSATVCHLANIAMELGRKLRWDTAKEQFIDDDQANRLTWRARREPWRL